MPEADAGDLFARYCLPGGRYKKLLSASFMRTSREQVLVFGRAMAADSRNASTGELRQLLGGDWREALTACWLIGFSRRREFQDDLHRIVSDENIRRTGKGIAFALARFCEPSDASVLRCYLECSLGDPLDRGNQPWFLGALLHVEKRLGVMDSQDLIAPEGLWQRWSSAGFLESADPFYWEREVDGWIDLAEMLD
ncbi:DUF6000 family protein [Streptomyces sp. NPDC088557]|uniref:DUF6000 family protein n=1 Tax=Streptomyces sp. NPDC088557 TaxID=3365867 RepID=UPI00382696A0